jgi:hypothetical protein
MVHEGNRRLRGQDILASDGFQALGLAFEAYGLRAVRAIDKGDAVGAVGVIDAVADFVAF